MAIDKTNVRFIFGIILIVCGWVICFDLFMLVFGISFFMLGTILVLFSKKSWLIKSLVVGIPIILWFVGFKLLLDIVNKKDAVNVIVNQGFSGQVRVVYGEEKGTLPETKDGRMMLNIPANGILIIRPFLKSGLTDIEYYRNDDKGVPLKINAVKPGEEKTAARPAGFFEGTKSSESNGQHKTASLDYIYDAFFILGNDSAKVLTSVEEKTKNPLTDSLVKVCRGTK
ncbi:MAG: hypothetical protein M3R17_05500 [Bacteroidota bacterium]|nr:hypothetical protein [Bacteroidota bacterium]